MDAKEKQHEDLLENIEKLHTLREHLQTLQENLKKAQNDNIPDRVREILAQIDARYEPKIEAVRKNIAQLEKEIKDQTLIRGETVRGENLSAVYNKGREKWDTSKLEGLAVVYPDILKLRSYGDPYVTIRKI